MSIQQQAIDILHQTQDGNLLTPHHLKLVECGVNGFLTETGEVAFEQLYQEVTTGVYLATPHWLCGIEHLTHDHEGYVYWKGQHVEHYSFHDANEMKAAAEVLAARCQFLETLGVRVSSNTAVWKWEYFALMQPGDPWLEVAYWFYAGIVDAQGAPCGLILYHKQGEKVTAVAKRDGAIETHSFEGAYEAFHGIRELGYGNAGVFKNDDFVAFAEKTGIKPEEYLTYCK